MQMKAHTRFIYVNMITRFAWQSVTVDIHRCNSCTTSTMLLTVVKLNPIDEFMALWFFFSLLLLSFFQLLFRFFIYLSFNYYLKINLSRRKIKKKSFFINIYRFVSFDWFLIDRQIYLLTIGIGCFDGCLFIIFSVLSFFLVSLKTTCVQQFDLICSLCLVVNFWFCLGCYVQLVLFNV